MEFRGALALLALRQGHRGPRAGEAQTNRGDCDEEISVGFKIAFTSKLSSEACSKAEILLEQLFPEEVSRSISQL